MELAEMVITVNLAIILGEAPCKIKDNHKVLLVNQNLEMDLSSSELQHLEAAGDSSPINNLAEILGHQIHSYKEIKDSLRIHLHHTHSKEMARGSHPVVQDHANLAIDARI